MWFWSSGRLRLPAAAATAPRSSARRALPMCCAASPTAVGLSPSTVPLAAIEPKYAGARTWQVAPREDLALAHGGVMRPLPKVAGHEHKKRAGDLHDKFQIQIWIETAEEEFDERIAGEDIARDPAENTRAAPDQDRKALEECQDQGAAGDDDRNADRKPDRQQHVMPLGDGGDRDHIVEAHDEIGDENDPDRAPQILDRLGRVFFVVPLRREQLDGDPEQRERAYHAQIRQR